jgi:pimeloyl-ACP methyl ester carboxylesterase
VSSLFIAGKKDWGIYQKPNALENMQNISCSNMQEISLIENAGHWVQQEKPEEVIKVLLNFISNL